MRAINKRVVVIDLLGLMISRTVLYSMNPVAIAFFAAAYLEKQMRFLLVLSILSGIALWMPIEKAIKYMVIILFIVVVVWIVEKRNIKLHPLAMGGIAALVTLMVSSYYLMDARDMQHSAYMMVLETVLVFVLQNIFFKSMQYMAHCRRGQPMDNEEKISVTILLAILVYAIPEYRNVEFSFTEAVAYLLMLFVGYKYGVGVGAISGAACGWILYMKDGTDMIGIMCALGICAGLFRKIGRVGTAVSYVISFVALGYFYENQLLEVTQVRALASSTVIFMLIPRFLLYQVDVLGEDKTSDSMTESIQNVAKLKLQDFSDSFLKLSKTFHTISEPKTTLDREDINQIFDELSDKLCRNCHNCNYCWKSNFYDTYKAAFTILSSVEENGEILPEDIPAGFTKQCINLDSFLYETNRSLEMAKMNLRWYNRMAESREAIAGQLGEVATIIDEFSKDLYDESDIPDDKRQEIINQMKQYHVEVVNVSSCERRNKKYDLYVTARTVSGRCMTTKEAATVISRVLGKRLKPSESAKNIVTKEMETIVFVEDTNFKTLTGMAKITKTSERISGDSFSFLHLDNGEMIMALSDGMGTGPEASEESESVVELLEQFMEAGFREQSAIKLINSILVIRSNEQSCSTIDMGIVNLFTGICQFIKVGAAATFIKRNDWVETIESTSLPVGVFNQVDIDAVTKKLYDGDVIVMLTDGVLDCIQSEEKEKYIQDLLMQIKAKNPQEIADGIMNHIVDQCEQNVIDDMTILVAGLWKK